MDITVARPTKLSNGEWGAYCEEEVAAGDIVLVAARTGKVWFTRVSEKIASTEHVSLFMTDKPEKEDVDAFLEEGGLI